MQGLSFIAHQAGQFYCIVSLHLLGHHVAFVVLRTIKETHCTYYIFSHIIACKEKSVQILYHVFSEGLCKPFLVVL